MFTSDAIRAFARIDEAIDEAVLAALSEVRIVDGRGISQAALQARLRTGPTRERRSVRNRTVR